MPHCCRWIALLLVLAAVACSEARQAPAPRPNILVIVVDTLRKDGLSLYGYPQPVSPAIDALAARGWTFENHHSHATQTVPATLSLLLSRLPADHGFSPEDPKDFARSRRPLYPPDFVFLAEVLREAGYETAAFVANPYFLRENGFDQGHDTFEPAPSVDSGERISAKTDAWLSEWGRTRERPFYAYLHYMDVHQPYHPPPRLRERFAPPNGGALLEGSRPLSFVDPRDLAYSRSLYAAAVAEVDEYIAKVLAQLDALGVRDETLIVLTADHGEEFGEHGGIGHGRSIYGEVVRVPLVMVYPPRLEAGRRIRHLSQHIDVATTILALANVGVPESFRGHSVLEPAQSVFLEIGPWRGVVANGSKWVWNRKTDAQQLFALEDEFDRSPLGDPALAAKLRAELDPYLAIEARRDPASEAARVGATWSREETERLRALGYVQ